MPVKADIRSLASWRSLVLSTAGLSAALIAAFGVIGLRVFVLTIGFTAH